MKIFALLMKNHKEWGDGITIDDTRPPILGVI
jgi:hypothetical protein